MSADVPIEVKVDQLNGHVIGLQNEVSGFRKAIEQLTQATLKLVRIDTNMQHIKSELDQVVEWNKKQDDRLNVLEVSLAVNNTRLSLKERVYWILFSGGISIASGFIVYMASH